MRAWSVDGRAALRLALLTGVGGLVLGVFAAVVALSAASSTSAVVVRVVLVTVLLLLAPHVVLGRCSREALLPTAVLGLVAGYLLSLGWWDGRTYGWQLVTGSAPVSALLDGVTWLVVGLASASKVSRRQDPSDAYS